MNIKKILSSLLVAALLLSLVPMAALAQSPVMPIASPRVSGVQTRTVYDAPTLAPGNHQSYLDRVAFLPDYALEYYRWMEDNACVGGALVDPTKAMDYFGEYYHTVTHIKGSEQFTFTSKDEMLQTAQSIAGTQLDQEFASFSAYIGVIQDVFDREHPEVFWLNGQYSSSYMGSYGYSTKGNVCTVTYEADMVVWLQYPGFDVRSWKYLDPQTVADTIAVRDAQIAEILDGCPEDSDYDRVAYLNDTLTARNAYNQAVAEGHSEYADSDAWECISALVGKSGDFGPVCEGYSRAFQTLCNELEIPCVTVNGDARSEKNIPAESHMWNYVQIDGGWYAVDVTWNDPYVSSRPDQKNSGYECREWFLLGSETQVADDLSFLASHEVLNTIRANGLAFTNGPVLEADAYDPNKVTYYSISGTVTSADNEAVTVELWQDHTLKATQTVTGKKANYTFESVLPGTYRLCVSKAGYVTRNEEVTVASADVTKDTKICQPGDITGDGRFNVGDVGRLYSHIKKTAIIADEYILLCADITGDGRLNMGDTGRLYAKIKG